MDYYILLGVKPSASHGEIRRAFRKLARKFHPDINPGDRVAAARFQRIAEAFDVLSDPGKREDYDTLGAQPTVVDSAETLSYGFAGFDFSLEAEAKEDIFPELFRSQAPRGSIGAEPGEDIHHRLSISFEESLRGLKTKFQVAPLVSCPNCLGWGEVPSNQPRPCAGCGGRGRVTQARGHMVFSRPCSECRGAGTIARQRCPDCVGAGRYARELSVTVVIPAGVNDGDRITVPEHGHQGRGGGRSGQLYVYVSVLPHALFTRKGENIYYTLPLSFTEAALGTRVDVPTPDGGSVKLRVPAGIQSGQKLRLSDRGAPSLRGGAKGDLFVVVQLVTPTIYDDKSRELLRELERLHPENPRDSFSRRSRSGGETPREEAAK